MKRVLGIDIGGSSVKAVLAAVDGHLLMERNLPFDPTAPLAFVETAKAIHLEMGEADLVGVSAPGLPAPDAFFIAELPNRLPGMEGLNWTRILGRDIPVPVLNDAQAALAGEVWLGAARGATNAIMFTLGTGVGGAAMVDGRLLRGHTGKAGHLGHICLDTEGPADICGMPGSLEMMIGNCTVQERSGGRFQSTHDLVSAVSDGDEAASLIWSRSVRALACAIGSCGNILDPEVAVVGGGIARAGALLFDPLERELRKLEWQTRGHQIRLVAAKLGELAGAYGAAWNALRVNGFTQSP